MAASLDSYSRSADYGVAAKHTADIVLAILGNPPLMQSLREKVVNINVPAVSANEVKGYRLTARQAASNRIT